MILDPPIDHAELCARVRFRLDEPTDLPQHELLERERYAAERTARLQAGGVRVTATLTPGLHAKLEEVRTRLLLPEAPALYVHSHGEVNASAAYGGRRCVLTATSALVNLLTLDEFGSILGHELAHIGMRHAHRDNEGGLSRVFMLERSRAAEVSCDRLSIVAAAKPRTVISAMLKVVSGMNSDHLTLDVDAFLAQLADRPQEVDLDWEALETHPVLPFRIWAIHRFSQTDVCRSLLGLEGGDPAEAVEDEICERFLAIGDGLTGRAVTDHLHEALVWTAALIIDDDESHSDTEMSVLASVAGSVWAEDVIRYLRTHGLRAVESRAKDSLRALSGAGNPVRQRVQSHLDMLLERLGAHGSRARVEAMLRDAWGDARR
jgi:hypothetical protein